MTQKSLLHLHHRPFYSHLHPKQAILAHFWSTKSLRYIPNGHFQIFNCFSPKSQDDSDFFVFLPISLHDKNLFG